MATALDQVPRNEGPEHRNQQAALSAVAWHPEPALGLAGWIHQGKRLGSISRGASWWVGDWVNYGNAKFGEKYTRAARVTGYDVQSLMNMAYVASRFDISRRRENLSWSHHAELASLPPEAQDQWLARADTKRLSVRGLREELRAWRARLKAAAQDAGTDDSERENAGAGPAEQAVACPRCGFRLAGTA